jgi:hypothetical protein
MLRNWLLVLCALAGARAFDEAAAEAAGESTVVNIALYHAFGAAPFSLRCRLRAELVAAAPAAAAAAAATGGGAAAAAAAAAAPVAAARWRVRAEGGETGGIAEAVLPLLAAAAAAGGVYRLRARVISAGAGAGAGADTDAGAGADADADAALAGAVSVTAATKLCLLLSAPDLRHDVFLALDGAGALRALDVRPALPAGFVGCAGAAPPDAALVPARAAPFAASRFGTVPLEESPPVPVANAGRAAPYLGQTELKDADAAKIATAIAAAQEAAAAGGGGSGGGSGGGALDAEAEAALIANLDGSRKAGGGDGAPAEPSLMQKAMPYLLGAYVIYTVAAQVMGKDEAPAAGGRGAAGGAAARAR